jgi:uncharacterized membrane protein
MNSVSFDLLLTRVNSEIVSPLLWVLFGLATIYFLYGVFEFVKNAGSEEGRRTGGQHIMWGLIGMFIMFSVKGIINLILGTITS